MSLTLANLPVTEMSINEMEAELEILEMVYGLFVASELDKGPSSLVTPVKESIQLYGERIRDIKNEIFERQVLVKS